MRNKNLLFGLAFAALVGLGFLLMTTRPGARAVADDSYRTSALSMCNYDFEEESSPGAAICASLSTTQTSDMRVHIQAYWRRPGQQNYTAGGATWADRVDLNTVTVNWWQPQSEYYSGDEVKIQFTCYDSGGSQTFFYERTAFIP
jgi:hypothetical protein